MNNLKAKKNQKKPFKCGCGLNGPFARANALYRHVKNKHGGDYPEGSTPRKIKEDKFKLRKTEFINADVVRNIPLTKYYGHM